MDMAEAPVIRFAKVTTAPRDWRVLSSYEVFINGGYAGRVTKTQDSTRTGGLWSARFAGVAVGHGYSTRAEAAAALLRKRNA